MYSEVTSVYVPVKTPDYPLWAIMLSAIVHALLVGVLIYFYHSSPPLPMETTLVSPEQLAEIEGQIKANQENTQTTSGNRLATPTQALTPVDTASNLPKYTDESKPNNPIETIKNDLTAKQAQWEKEQALFAEQLDREVAAEQQEVIDQLNQQSDNEQRSLQNFRAAENNLEELRKETRANAKAYNKNLNPKHDGQSDTAIQSFDLGRDGKAMGSDQSQSSSQGTKGPSRRGSSSGGSKASYINAIYTKIYNNWDVPKGSKGKSLSANLKITPSGDVQSINFTGNGDAVFENSLRDAINRSNPLPMPDDPSFYQSFGGNISLNFKGSNQ